MTTNKEGIKWVVLGDDDFEWVEYTGPELDENGNPIPPTSRPNNEGEIMPEGPGFRPSGDWVEPEDKDYIPGRYTDDLTYTGTAEYVIIPEKINGKIITSYRNMFYKNTTVRGVKSSSEYVTMTNFMFEDANLESLYLDINTKNVANMLGMFRGAHIGELHGLDGFDTSSLTAATWMFLGSTIGNQLKLNSFYFDGRAVNVRQMFHEANLVGPLDLSSLVFTTSPTITSQNVTSRINLSGDARILVDESQYDKLISYAGYNSFGNATLEIGGQGYIPPGQPTEEVIEQPGVIEFKTRKVKDREMKDGETELVQEGINGNKVDTVKVITHPDGTEEREVLSTRIIKQAQDEIIRVGTLVSKETVKEDEEIPHETLYYKDYEAREGERVEQRGIDGYRKKTFEVITHSDGYVEKTLKNEDYKDPTTEIIAIGMIERTNRVTKEEEVPHRTLKSYSYNHRYKEGGEPHVVEAGKVGIIKRTYEVTTYTDDTPQQWDLIPELTTRTEPEDEVLIYGLIKSEKEVKEENILQFKVETRYSADLLEGEERVIQDGKDGLDIRYYDVTEYVVHPETGVLKNPTRKEKEEKRDYTAPTHYIIEIGSKDPIKNIEEYFEETTIKHETRYVETDELYEGQEQVSREGKDGKIIVKYQMITFIDDSTTRHDIGTEEIPPITQIIKVGTKDPVISTTEETVDEVIPYESAIIKTNELEPGVSEVVKQGINGVATRTYKVEKLWDGRTRKELISEDRTEAVFEVITLGTSKEIISQYEYPETTEIPFETERIQTDTLYVGQTKVKEPGRNGEIKNIYVRTEFEDGIVERVLIGKTTTPPINQVILVGTRNIVYQDSLKNIEPLNNKMSGEWLFLEDGDSFIRVNVPSTFRPKWGYL